MCAALASSRLLGDRLEYWADTTPDREALAFGDQRWTWAQWRDRIRRAAAGLAAAGIGPGDRVAFLDRNHPACLEITFAAASIGAANTVVNWRLAPAELDYVLNDSGARILFAGPDRLSTLKPPTVEKTIVTGPSPQSRPLPTTRPAWCCTPPVQPEFPRVRCSPTAA
jgi:acyl-CoA synthetase (AMP-forming)/AMP-acid ligase II